MYPVLRWERLAALIALIYRVASATAPTALSVTPSTKWYGDDGAWSAISIRVGTPPQWVDVMVSTVSSETWVVGPGGCSNNTLCESLRGGIFNSTQSSTWQPEGFFELGVDAQLGNTAYAEYGLDDLTFGTTGVILPSAIIGSINSTEDFLGYFGLGIVPGNFTTVTPLAAISGLVEKDAAIPSHSYGFTAGATYQQKGEPISLTLGGYDANRFVPHNISFELNPSQQPQAYINSISVSSAANSNNWTDPIQLLSSADRVTAIIDSSTPYLWLPQSACDQFARVLGLSYNSSLNLYTFDSNPSQHDTLGDSELAFTFSLSDIGASTQVVNITLPYAAFDLQLSFPAIPNTTYGSADSFKFYFPLRQATNQAQYTIGRSFLQEAYLITDYERNNFSVYQAVHTADPIGNTSIVAISRPSTSTFSGPATGMTSKTALKKGAIVGIAVGVAAITAFLAVTLFYFCRRRKQQRHDADEEKASEAQPRTFLDRVLRRAARPRLIHEARGSIIYPTEVGADASHERYELPASFPVELDSESGTFSGTTQRGTQDSLDISAYERARRKLERQQRPPVNDTYPIEKNENDVSEEGPHRPLEVPDIDSPQISPVAASSGGSLTMSGQPSPVSPGFGSQPISPTSPLAPPPVYRRMNPQNVVYVGRLPNNVQLPAIVPRLIGRDGRTIRVEDSLSSEERTTSLGSHHTEVESDDLYGSDNDPRSHEQATASGAGSGSGRDTSRSGEGNAAKDESKFRMEDMRSLRADMQTRELLDPWGSRTRHNEDLVHVPVPAQNRFSWEEDRLEGTD